MASRSRKVRDLCGTFLACLLAGGIVALLFLAHGQMQEDAEYSNLYRTTLEAATSRFKAGDKTVPVRSVNSDMFDGEAQAHGIAPGSASATPSKAAGSMTTHVSAPPLPSPREARQANMPPRLQPAAGTASTASPPAGSLPVQAGEDSPFVRQARARMAKQPTGPAISAEGAAEDKLDRKAAAASQSATTSVPDHLDERRGPEPQSADQLIAAARQPVVADPADAVAHHRLADALRHAGRSEEALAEYEQTLALKPNFYCVYIHMGDLHTALQRAEPAEEAFAKAIAGYQKEIQEDGGQAHHARYELAKFYLDHHRNFDEALKLTKEAVAAAQDNGAYQFVLARCYGAVGDTRRALAALDKAIQLDPDQAATYRQYRDQLTAPPPATAPAGG